MVHLLLFLFSLLPACLCSLYSENGPVYAFADTDTFVNTVIGSPKAWVVEFYASSTERSQLVAPEFVKAAEHNQGIVSFAAIDCEEETGKQICDAFGIQSDFIPAILGFASDIEAVPPADGKGEGSFGKLPRKYEGSGNAAAFSRFAVTLLVDRVKILNDGNAEKLLSTRWYTNLPGISGSKSTRFSIVDFPTLVVITDSGVIKHEGALKHKEIKEFLLKYSEKRIGGGTAAAGATDPDSTKHPEPAKKESVLWHVKDQASWEKACPKAGWCFVTFLDSQSEDHESNLKVLDDIKTKFPSFRIIWLDGPQNESFKAQFNLADGYPQAVLITRSKLVSRPMRSAFDSELIIEFLKIAKEGKGKRFTKLDSDPKFEKSDL